MIVGFYGMSLCLLMPSVLNIGGFGELGELSERLICAPIKFTYLLTSYLLSRLTTVISRTKFAIAFVYIRSELNIL